MYTIHRTKRLKSKLIKCVNKSILESMPISYTFVVVFFFPPAKEKHFHQQVDAVPPHTQYNIFTHTFVFNSQTLKVFLCTYNIHILIPN